MVPWDRLRVQMTSAHLTKSLGPIAGRRVTSLFKSKTLLLKATRRRRGVFKSETKSDLLVNALITDFNVGIFTC